MDQGRGDPGPRRLRLGGPQRPGRHARQPARFGAPSQDVFEPGSTAKTITMAAALEEGVATPTSQFVAPYAYETTYRDVPRLAPAP